MRATDELSVVSGATRYLLRSILLVRDTELSAPTPCRDWDLRHLLRHICASLHQLTDVLADRGRATDTGPETNLVDALRIRTVDLLLGAMSLPTAGRWCEIGDRIVPARTVVDVAAIEMALHGWDIAQACRMDRPVPADLAATLLKVAPPLAEAGLAERVFAAPVELLPTATPSDQLVALFGRRRLDRAAELRWTSSSSRKRKGRSC